MTTDPADRLRAERGNASVLKADLARLRERDRCKLVVVLEGKEDLPVYEAWLKRVDPCFEWEPLVARGKSKLLEFRSLLQRDQTGMSVCTFFILDHDYDGLRGQADGEEVYVLPAYSVENFLSDEVVVESYLRADLRIVGRPDVRSRILEEYRAAFVEFIRFVRPACEHLRAARSEACGNVVVRDPSFEVLISHEGVEVQFSQTAPATVETDLPLSDTALRSASEFFDVQPASLWIRGKFLLSFMRRFCEAIYQDRVSASPILFDDAESDRSLSQASFDVRNLAARSPLPAGLVDALDLWRRSCQEACGERTIETGVRFDFLTPR